MIFPRKVQPFFKEENSFLELSGVIKFFLNYVLMYQYDIPKIPENLFKFLVVFLIAVKSPATDSHCFFL